jgi:thioredoxin-like negative regulator of GroEL
MANRFNVWVPGPDDPRQAAAALHVAELLGKDYEAQVTGAALPVVLDFYAAGSKACETLAPRLAAVAEKYAGKVRFLKIQRSANAELAARFGVTAEPTVLFLKGGKEQGERLSGEKIPRAAIKARVDALLGLAPSAPQAAPPAAPSA